MCVCVCVCLCVCLCVCVYENVQTSVDNLGLSFVMAYAIKPVDSCISLPIAKHVIIRAGDTQPVHTNEQLFSYAVGTQLQRIAFVLTRLNFSILATLKNQNCVPRK